MRNQTEMTSRTIYSTLIFSYILTGIFFYGAYYLLDPFFRISSPILPDTESIVGSDVENPIFRTALYLYSVIRSSTALFYFFVLFSVLVFLSEIPYVILAVLHYSAASRRKYSKLVHYEPLVSIIIPAHNEEKVIATALDSLLETDYKEKEIIVVDDGSTDRTADIVSGYLRKNLVLLRRPRGGKASALNNGLAYANGEIIVMVDSDSAISIDSIRKIVRNFENDDVVAVAGNVKVGNRGRIFSRLQSLEYIREINLRRSAFDLLNTIYVVPGAIGAFRADILRATGAYDTDTIVEDMDLTLKILKTGKRILYEKEAVSYTEAPESITEWARQRRRWYGGTLQTIFKHRKGWWKYGTMSFVGFPYLVLSTLIVPIIEVTALIVGVIFGILGFWLGILLAFALAMVLELFTSIIGVALDREDPKLILYSPLFLGYRYLIDFVRILTFWDVLRGQSSWHRSERYGKLPDKVKLNISSRSKR